MSKRDAHAYSTNLLPLAARLIRVATPGVLIAACGTTNPHGGQGGAGGSGGTPTDAAAGTGGTSNLPAIPPPPVGGTPQDGGAAYPQCYGEGNPMLHGPCCLRVFCIEPPAGQTACKPANAVTSQEIGYPSLGSGTCMCSVPGRPPGFGGPYSPESAQQYSTSQGSCCYLVGLQWCTGRPLIIEGRGVVAELISSAGWV
ncbi:MAG TPA: hypothetical protein VI072_27725 [Polyangiaceae bacterium]